jgi:hypothetical protein
MEIMFRIRRGVGIVSRYLVNRSGWRAAGPVVASVVAVLAAPAGSAQTLGGGGNGPTIQPYGGTAFVPTTGDWEGIVNGFPASFSLRLVTRNGIPGYGLNDVVALHPSTCPSAQSVYAEAVIRSKRSSVVGPAGSLGLSGVGFRGGLTGRRSATMSARFHSGSCARSLRWHMHPAKRLRVGDGSWTIRFGDGESGTFHVLAGGRLATAIHLPAVVTRCNGAVGAVDLFIRPSGVATLSGATVHSSIRFSDETATGKMSAGGRGCTGRSVSLTAKLK